MKLKIAQVAPLWESVPPPRYGGIEMGVSLLTEGLVKKGHDVTLFAAGTSKTTAKLSSVYPKPLYRAGISWDNIVYPYLNFISAFSSKEKFDIVHIHLCLLQDYLSLSLPQLMNQKVVFTTRSVLPPHKSENPSDQQKLTLLNSYKNNNFISISNSQRKGWESLNWVKNIYNGIEVDKYKFEPKMGEHLVWVGKIRPEKGVHEAIKLANRLGEKLVIAGPIDENHVVNMRYWKEKIEPQINNKNIIYVGEVTREKVAELFQDAKAFINPIQWAEAFGLVMAESQCCGTPVITYNKGSASEVVVNGRTGFVVDTFEEMVESVKKIDQIDRKTCHDWAVSNFSSSRMVDEYEELYKKILGSN